MDQRCLRPDIVRQFRSIPVIVHLENSSGQRGSEICGKTEHDEDKELKSIQNEADLGMEMPIEE